MHTKFQKYRRKIITQFQKVSRQNIHKKKKKKRENRSLELKNKQQAGPKRGSQVLTTAGYHCSKKQKKINK